MIYLDQIMS